MNSFQDKDAESYSYVWRNERVTLTSGVVVVVGHLSLHVGSPAVDGHSRRDVGRRRGCCAGVCPVLADEKP